GRGAPQAGGTWSRTRAGSAGRGGAPRAGTLGRRRSGPELPQARVESAELQQIGVAALLVDPAAMQDEDPVGVLDRREAMGDGDARPVLQEPRHRLSNERLRL